MKSFIGQSYELQSKLLKLSPNSREVNVILDVLGVE